MTYHQAPFETKMPSQNFYEAGRFQKISPQKIHLLRVDCVIALVLI